MHENDDIRSSIVEFWKAVLFALMAFALLVVYIFASSAINWRREQERLELLAQQKVVEKTNKISVYAFVNRWGGDDDPTHQYRYLEKLEIGKEYDIGQLRQIDVNDLESNKNGFDHIIFQNDDLSSIDPVITLQYANYIHVQYSLGCEGSWLISGATAKGLKTGEWLYTLPEESECTMTDEYDGWGEKSLTFKVPVNGQGGLEVNIDSPLVSENMQQYNYITTERFGDEYSGVPEQYADRTRAVYTSHIIVEGWKVDPNDRRNSAVAPSTPEITVLIRLKNYGEWDITKDEYDSMKYTVYRLSDLSYHDYSPKTTIEYVGIISK